VLVQRDILDAQDLQLQQRQSANSKKTRLGEKAGTVLQPTEQPQHSWVCCMCTTRLWVSRTPARVGRLNTCLAEVALSHTRTTSAATCSPSVPSTAVGEDLCGQRLPSHCRHKHLPAILRLRHPVPSHVYPWHLGPLENVRTLNTRSSVTKGATIHTYMFHCIYEAQKAHASHSPSPA
jgi:hypothetical protein